MKNTITGRIASDITITNLEKGSVVNFRIAENKQGRKETSFYNGKAWNGLGERFAEYVRKGDLVKLSVDVQPNSYVTKEGELKEELVLTVDRFNIIQRSRKQEVAN